VQETAKRHCMPDLNVDVVKLVKGKHGCAVLTHRLAHFFSLNFFRPTIISAPPRL